MGWVNVCRLLILALALAGPGALLRAESGTLPSAPAGVVETGVPSFVVLGAESLGFSTAPTDLHLLPDGRILVVSQHEIAIGDGVRWETFQQAAGQPGFISSQVGVDVDGRIYSGISGAIARIDIGEDRHWRFVPVMPVSTNDPYSHLVQFPDTWLWYSGGDAVIAWRPGQTIRTSRLPAAVEHLFAFGHERFASNGSSGSLYKLQFGGEATLVSPATVLVADTVTCSTEYAPDQTIVGTAGDGLRVFDGRSFSNFPVSGILGPGRHINDLCRIGADYFAAAVDTTGIVFFDRGGRIVQVLNRALDHRLARARHLAYSRDGVLWALLDNVVACARFPSPTSDFAPLLASVMNYARPQRHQGGLWILADGRLFRGVYDADRCLGRFELDTPPGRFVWAVAETKGRLFATNEEGIFLRIDAGWQQVAAGIINARVGIGPEPSDGRVFYVARGEVGWLHESAGQYSVQRLPVKGLGEVYNAVDDPSGAVWLELGTNQVGRVQFGADGPTVKFFGKEDGLGESWVSIFALDGIVRFSSSLHLQRFDARTERFIVDEELARHIPMLAYCTGRPARDASGRLWFASEGAVHFVDDRSSGENPPVGSLPLGFEPTEFKMEAGGVIWMQGREHLIRFDPRMAPPPPPAQHAQITSVQLTASDRHVSNPGPTLPALPYADNSLLVRFAAVANPFGPPVFFEVMLEGATDRWASTGTLGSVSFNRLREGRYTFHVRPVMGGTAGEEARLAFTVQPPWFRTKLAWGVYIFTAVGLVLLVAWYASYLERREAMRLARLVTERTAKLNATNTQLTWQIEETVEKTTALAASEERYRRLNRELEDRVAERTAELSTTNVDLRREIAERQRAEEEKERLNAQLAQAQKMESVGRLAGGVAHDFNNMLQAILGNAALALESLPPGNPARENLEEIQKSAQRSAALTSQLLAFARKQTIQPRVLDLNDTVAGALKMLGRLIGENIHLAWIPGAGLWPVRMDPSQIDQVLANLCVNARDAIAGVGRVTIETGNVTLDDTTTPRHPETRPGDYVLLAVSDDGRGMDPTTRARLFEPFFTTKEEGKGTGLGLATVFGAVVQNLGLINVESAPGQGTTFKIYLPRAIAEPAAAARESAGGSVRGTEAVLLVEDEEQILNLGRRILEQNGYTVLAVATPQAALAAAEQYSGPLHLLVTDVVMPGMNGKELRDLLRASRPDLKCLFMSGYTADVIADDGVLDDGVHFIQKPFSIPTFVETVRSVCQAG